MIRPANGAQGYPAYREGAAGEGGRPPSEPLFKEDHREEGSDGWRCARRDASLRGVRQPKRGQHEDAEEGYPEEGLRPRGGRRSFHPTWLPGIRLTVRDPGTYSTDESGPLKEPLFDDNSGPLRGRYVGNRPGSFPRQEPGQPALRSAALAKELFISRTLVLEAARAWEGPGLLLREGVELVPAAPPSGSERGRLRHALVYPASRYAFAPLPGIERVLLLGYGNLCEAEIERGLAAIAESIRA